jgi:hypothetical protein
MTIYSGYIHIETTGEDAYYEFDSEEGMTALDQLDFMLNIGIIQIIDNPPQEEEDEDE